MKMQRRIRMAAIAAVAALGLLAAGCSSSGGGDAPSDGGSTDSTASGELTKVKVGIIPVAPYAVLQLGIDQGFFEEQGLEVELVPSASVPTQISALQSGSIDFLMGNPISPLIAIDKGMDLHFIAGFQFNNPEQPAAAGALVGGPDLVYGGPLDLEGKRVGVNSLGNTAWLSVRDLVDSAGGDSSTIEFVELPIPEGPAQLENGGVDAAFAAEPFISMGVAAGGTVISDVVAETGNELILATTTNGQMMKDHADTVEAFRNALTKTFDYANENDPEHRQAIADFADIPLEAATGLPLCVLDSRISQADVGGWADLALKYGVISKAPNLSDIVLELK